MLGKSCWLAETCMILLFFLPNSTNLGFEFSRNRDQHPHDDWTVTHLVLGLA